MVKNLTPKLAFVLTLLLAQSASAQTPACSASEAVGWLGITGLSCSNCVFSYPGEGRPSLFSTEPRITAVASNSPAASSLRTGDVLVSIDDNLITTHAGGLRLANLKPGETVQLEVRRNGELLRQRLANLPALCPFDARVPGSRARPGGFVDGSTMRRGVGGGAVANVGGRLRIASPVAAPRMFTPSLLPRASFGFGISCSACTARTESNGTMVWHFNELPEIYSVEEGSQARARGIQRGDVITRIDDMDITSQEGGRRFGRVEPGQNVRFTFRRGSTSFTRELQAAEHYTIAMSPARVTQAQAQYDVQYQEALRAVQQSLEQMRQQELREHEQLDELRKLNERELRELTDRLLRSQADQARKMTELRSELARAAALVDRTANVRARATTSPAPARVGGGRVATTAPAPAARERNTIRYSGKLGATEIEVRGLVRPTVRETADEIIIETGDSTIRLKKSSTR